MWPFGRRAEFVTALLRSDQAVDCARIHESAFARPWSSADILSLLSQPGCQADAALDARTGKLAGFAISRVMKPEAELLTIAVAASARRKGVATKLLAAHLPRIRAAGGEEMFLEVDEENAPALRLYRSFGFSEVGKRPGYYPRKDGAPATALILRAQLG